MIPKCLKKQTANILTYIYINMFTSEHDMQLYIHLFLGEDTEAFKKPIDTLE